MFIIVVDELLVGENDCDLHNANAEDDDGDERDDDEWFPPSFLFLIADLGEGVNGEEGAAIAMAALATAEEAIEASPLVLPEPDGRGGSRLFVYIIVATGLGENRVLPSLSSAFPLRCRCCCCCNCCCSCAAVNNLV